MIDVFRNHIKINFPQLANCRFYIAVSGGIDSMVLLHLFQQFNYEFGILHCNFKLRGAESDADMKFVQEYGNKHLIPWSVGHFDTKEYAKEMKISIQVAARELRYDWFLEQLFEKEASYVLTAHHLDDSLETFIINLSRGTGIDGLIGIPEENDAILRPLLPFSRKEIEEYAKKNNLKWRDDSSNDLDKYTRNKIRHKIVPELKDLNPFFLNSFQKSIEFLKQTQELAEDAAYFFLSEVSLEKPDGIYYNINKIKQLPYVKPYLYYWFKNYGFTAWNDIYNLLDAQSGKQVFSDTHVLLKDRDALILFENNKNELENEIYYVEKNQKSVNNPIKLTLTKWNKIAITNSKCIFVDEDKLKFPLTIRKWNEGDFFYPFGMKGKKKLSKYFKDEKFSLLDKENTWLLCSDNQIVWVIENRLDERYKTTTNTTNILKIELK